MRDKRDVAFETDLAALDQLGARLGHFGKAEVNQIKAAAGALARLAQSGDSEQHRARVTQAAQTYRKSLERASASLSEREVGGLQALTEARRQRLRLETDKFVLPVIEQFRTAPDRATRLQYLKEVTESANGAALAALSEAPSFVTGLDAETLNQHLDYVERERAPDLAERREQFDADRETVARALEVAERVAVSAFDLESIERAEEADKAEAELRQATG